MYIVATISKNSYPADKIEQIIKEGARVLRYNFSHGTPEEMKEKIQVARDVIGKLGLSGKVNILADLPGDKVRLGKFQGAEHHVDKGQEVLFKTAEYSDDPNKFVPINLKNVGQFVETEQEISFGDGEIAFKVTKIIDSKNFSATALNTRIIPQEKGVNFGQAIDTLDHITKKTMAHLENIANIKPDWVAFSFINSANILKQLKELLNKHYPNNNVRIVSKIESPLAIKNLEEIIDETDIAMVARGDLGLTVPYEKLGILQKKIIKESKNKKKEVIVATQVLDSLMTYYIPSRAEISDLTNIILDGADGIMMAKETGISATPDHSVKVAKRIIDEVKNTRI